MSKIARGLRTKSTHTPQTAPDYIAPNPTSLPQITHVSYSIPHIRARDDRCEGTSSDIDQERRSLGSRLMTKNEGLITDPNGVNSTQWSDTARHFSVSTKP